MQVKNTDANRISRRGQRGATMVSVMLLTVSLLTVAMLVVRSSSRELQQAGALVKRERALMAAQATLDLGAARYRQAIAVAGQTELVLNTAIAGQFANPSSTCSDIAQDCIPGEGVGTPVTGQRNSILTSKSDCAGRPCMRPGALAELPNAAEALVPWVEVRLADLIDGGDTDAVVTLWVRNNTADALGAPAGVVSNFWTEDRDARVVLTAMATVNNTTVAVEQEMSFAPGAGLPINNMASPDEGYGGGHNNDNASVRVCKEAFLGAGA